MVSEEACSLLCAMIKVPVQERITVEEIKIHPWFATNLDDSFEMRWENISINESLPQVGGFGISGASRSEYPDCHIL